MAHHIRETVFPGQTDALIRIPFSVPPLSAPTTCQVVDNQRVLHGRTAFQGGVREMVGCYVGRDEYESRLRAFGLLPMRG
ncbi:hypothetical protein T492DRAFT_1046735 [Pavlovales sp. CCMP2436]|nr:hypothetical protein T492DRAFT_1046735 [Pavlovales sp. CCMP2436]|mmetsp:Transcript_18373/g.47003  ORF Transcript_18373/g.47003 Transcript_18373/m.47003 type:complete len:80 (+) Transcript_18373:109-348(+)